MRPVYAYDAERLTVAAVDAHAGGRVQLEHQLLNDNGNFTSYWTVLTPKAARRLARQLRAAAHESEQTQT